MRRAKRLSYSLLGLLLGVALHATAGQAPADSALHALTLPIAIGQRLSCVNKDSASLTKLTFSLGEAPGATRNIEAAYDSLGHARMLVDWGTVAGGARTDLFIVRFNSAGEISYSSHRLDSLPSFAHQKLQVTPAEKLRAKALAAWAWDHKCHKHPSPTQ